MCNLLQTDKAFETSLPVKMTVLKFVWLCHVTTTVYDIILYTVYMILATRVRNKGLNDLLDCTVCNPRYN